LNLPLPSLVASFGNLKLLDPSVELAEVHVVSAVWDLLDRSLGVRRLLGNDKPESEEDESSGGSPLGGKDTLLGGSPGGGSF